MKLRGSTAGEENILDRIVLNTEYRLKKIKQSVHIAFRSRVVAERWKRCQEEGDEMIKVKTFSWCPPTHEEMEDLLSGRRTREEIRVYTPGEEFEMWQIDNPDVEIMSVGKSGSDITVFYRITV